MYYLRSLFIILIYIIGINFSVYSFVGGDGSIANPYQISNCTHLQNMSSNLGANYSLNGNVDCGVPPYSIGAGFSKVGINCIGSNRFKGSLNGNNFEIQNFYLNSTSSSPNGLFGCIDTIASVYDLGLTNVNVKVQSSGGALIGYNYGNVDNVYVTGNLTGSNELGLVVGYNTGNGVVDNSYSSGIISGSDSIGGLVGENLGAIVNNSYSSATVTGSNYVGGLVGDGRGTTVNSYAIGIVTGTSQVGGLVGRKRGSNMSNTYATGNVRGSSRVGGLIGSTDNSIIINHTYATGNVNGGAYSGGLIGESDAFIDNSYAIGYVNSSGSRSGGFVGGNTGTILRSYAKGNVNGTSYLGGLVGYNGLKIENTYAMGNVTSFGATDYTGGLVGRNNGIIENSYSYGNVNGTDKVGGLVGDNDGGAVNNSFSLGNVSGSVYVGGLVGQNNAGAFTNSYWNNHSGNVGNSVGDGSGVGVVAIADNLSWFYDSTQSPLNLWDTSYWYFSGSGLGILQWQLPPSSSANTLSSIFPFGNFVYLITILVLISTFLLFS
ncbi:MAG: hypothetical protein KC550_03910 [Nanoarchaeota archaeon]|nr:hypothetical protein [Nanoarchaeota archaeon]